LFKFETNTFEYSLPPAISFVSWWRPFARWYFKDYSFKRKWTRYYCVVNPKVNLSWSLNTQNFAILWKHSSNLAVVQTEIGLKLGQLSHSLFERFMNLTCSNKTLYGH